MAEEKPRPEVGGRAEDAELLRQVAAGQAFAQRELVRRLLPRVRATTRWLCRDDAEADDMAQLALIEILRSAASFRGEARVERWADRITVRTVMHRVRRRRRRESFEEPVPEETGVAPEGPHHEAVRRALRRRLAHHLARLSEDRRTAVVLKLVHGCSVEEIAGIVGVSVNTVKDRLRVGRARLRDMLRKDPALRDDLWKLLP
jgi:RNA polymerase sigma-70 factor (ECF subfamily)